MTINIYITTFKNKTIKKIKLLTLVNSRSLLTAFFQTCRLKNSNPKFPNAIK
jgi:hypothetical protein